MSTANSRFLEDVRVGVRLKISALWIAMLFLFTYRDIFGFFAPRPSVCSDTKAARAVTEPRGTETS